MKYDFQRLHVTVEITFLYVRMCIIRAKLRPVERTLFIDHSSAYATEAASGQIIC